MRISIRVALCLGHENNLSFLSKVILSEKAIESGGTMDMDDVQTEEEMAKKMETIDKKMLDEAADNIPLQVWLNE